MGRKGSHSDQFRKEACKLVREQGYSVVEAAKQLDVPYNTLWNWLSRLYGPRSAGSAEADPSTSDDPALLRSRIRELEKQVHRLEMEKEILKKATAYFAQERT
jgi:transposase